LAARAAWLVNKLTLIRDKNSKFLRIFSGHNNIIDGLIMADSSGAAKSAVTKPQNSQIARKNTVLAHPLP
jgi:hypothetical protein